MVDAAVLGRSVFETHDPEGAARYLDAMYGASLRIQFNEPGHLMRHERLGNGPVTIDQLALPVSFDWRVDPLPALLVAEPAGGTLRRRTSGEDAVLGAGSVGLVSRLDETAEGHTADLRYRVTSVDPGLLGAVAGADPTAIRFTRLEPVTEADRRRWRSAVHFLESAVLTNPDVAASPLLVAHASRLVAATMLAVFPNDLATVESPLDRSDTGPVSLRRATEFIELHAHEAIGLTDIAAYAGVTTRTLQHAFRRHRGTTPLAHLRRIRLERAHLDLAVADPLVDTVPGIAARWGFAAERDFARSYRQAYGRSPQETLGE